MSVNLSPLAGAGAQFFTDSGTPLTGGLLYTYAAGTTTPATTYSDSGGLTANANPIVLNAAGRVAGEVWLVSGTSYKFVLKTATLTTIGTWDNIDGVNDVAAGTAFYADTFTCTAGQTTFTLTANPGSINNLTVSLDGAVLVAGTDFSWTGTTVVLSMAAYLNQVLRVAYSTAAGVKAISPGSVVDASVAVSSKLYNRIYDTVSVKDFGAVGDGVADDTVAIQAALLAATGKALYFPASTSFYAVSDELTIPAGSKVYGDGWGSKVKQTVVNKNLFVMGHQSSIDGLHLIGRASGATDFTKNSGVFANAVGTISVTNNYVEQFEGSGVEIRACHDVSITNNWFFANIWSSYSAGVAGASTADILLYSAAANSSRMLISGNFCLSNNSQGIYADALGGNGDLVISNNICVTLDPTTCTVGGAWTEFAMTTNASALQRRHGIICSYSAQSQNGPRATIIGNLCRNTSWTGIYKDGISQGGVLIAENVCTKNGYAISNSLSGGIWLYADGYELVEGNYISDFKNTDVSGSGGITVYSTVIPTKRTVVRNNTVRTSANCGVYIGTNAAYVDILDNTLQDITRDGILWIPNSGQAGVGGHRIEGNSITRASATVRPAINVTLYASTLVTLIKGNCIYGSDNTTVSAVNAGVYVAGGSSNELVQVVDNRIDTHYYGYYNDSAWTGRNFTAQLEGNLIASCNTGFIVRANTNNVTVPLVRNRFISVTNSFGADGFNECGKIVEKVGSRLYWESTAVPSIGSWTVGDRSQNSTPAVGSPKAWACTVAGTPGTWVSEGNL